MPLADDTVTVPHVRIDLADPRGTNRPVFAPIYEQPLLERLWANTSVTISVTEIPARGPGDRPWPVDMLQRETTEAEEEARLKEKYLRNPSTKEPIFERVYGFGLFHEAFERAVSGAWAPPSGRRGRPADERRGIHPAMQPKPEPEPEPEATPDPDHDIVSDESGLLTEGEEQDAPAPNAQPWSHLTKVKGVGDELARALFEDGITEIEELAAMPLLELKAYMGVGEKSGQRILDSASELAIAGMEG